MFLLKDVDSLIMKNISLRKEVFIDSDISIYKKERKKFLNRLKKVKSKVVRKSMLRSLVMKNILLRFITEDASFLDA